MTKYRVTADTNNKAITCNVDAQSEDDAWEIVCDKFVNHLYNGKVEELPTRAELLARIQELETAGRELVTATNYDQERRRNIPVVIYKHIMKFAALLINTPLEKE